MVKLRLTSIDSKAAIDEIRAQAVGMRLVNVYDLSPRVYLLKFGQGERKVYLLFESGVRLHITNYSREKPKVPSQFTLKLRKHVRSWRLESVKQLGTDRVVDMQFGGGDSSFHFIMELYGHGNFALTDSNYSIMMLLRSAKSEDVRLAVREIYPIGNAKFFVARTREEIVEALEKAAPTETLRGCVPLNYYGTLLGDHMLASCGLNPAEKKRVWADDIQSIADSVFDVCRTIDEMLEKDLAVDGGLLLQLKPPASSAATPTTTTSDASAEPQVPRQGSDVVGTVDNADEFWPACIEVFLDKSRIVKLERTKTFSEAADRCFRVTEQGKIDTHNEKRDQVALSKKEKFMREHQRRIDNLTAEQQKNEHLAEVIQTNIEDVDAAIDLVNGVLATGMSWDSLASLIRHRQAEGRFPVANIIHNLKLHKNQISLLLAQDCGDDDDCEDADIEPVIVDVDISLNAYNNAAQYHTVKKAVKAKLTKTIDATDKAAAAAESHGQKLVKKVVERSDITHFRNPSWFEKFNWFMTSHGYMVVAGHDTSQADLLFRRYLAPSDVWIHGDAPGCLPMILKNTYEHDRVPLSSIEEAGIMCIARSEAWRKSPVSAWWCVAAQVSNKTPQGDHLVRGTFSIRGQKNYMPAMQLQLAVALLFRTDAKRTPRETAGLPVANVKEVIEQLQQQQSGQPLTQVPEADQQPSGDLAGIKKNTLKHLKRGQGSAHATPSSAAAGVPTATDTTVTVQTMSVTSTRTGASKGLQTGGASPVSTNVPTPQDMTNNQNLTSRQLSKIRKIKKKYSEQDDQDRLRAMELLGHGLAKDRQVIGAEPAKQEDDEGGVPFLDGASSVAADTNIEAEAMKQEDEDGAAPFLDRAPSLAADTNIEAEATKQEDDDGGVPFLDGAPSLADDTNIHEVLVVCAPYASVRHYTFKARIAPGQEKKGQAAQEILHGFTKAVEPVAPQAVQALKAVSADSIIAQLPGHIKLHVQDMSSSAPTSKPNDNPNLTMRQIQKLKKEEQEKELMDKLRAERKMRQAAREAQHADPAVA